MNSLVNRPLKIFKSLLLIVVASSALAKGADQESMWYGSISSALGYDDNVLNPTDDADTQSGDEYLESMASVVGSFGRWRVTAFTYINDFQDVDAYDTSYFGGCLFHDMEKESSTTSWGLEVDRSYVDGQGFTQQIALSFDQRWKLLEDREFRARFKYTDIQSIEESYDGFSGDRQQLYFDYTQKFSEDFRWRLSYQFTSDNRDDIEGPDYFTSLSADRHQISSKWQLQNGNWDYELSIKYKDSQYRDDHIYSDGFSVRRHDKLYNISTLLNYYWNENWGATFEVAYSDNQSTLESYAYQRTLIQMGLSYLF